MASIYKRGKYWRAQVRRTGYPTLNATFDTKEDAALWAAKKEKEIAEHAPERITQRIKAREFTFRQALERYASQVLPSKSPKTQKVETTFIRNLLASEFASLALVDIGGARLSAQVQQWQEQKSWGANTIRLHLAVVSHLFNIARKEWDMPALVNPVELIRKPRLPRGRERRLVGDEEERLLATCEATNPELAEIVRFAIETAMRQGEILDLTWNNIDLRAHTAFLEDTKNGESRIVPLSMVAQECLERQRVRNPGSGRVWTYTADGLRASYFKAVRKAGIVGLTFHDLRHEATSRLCERGLPIMTVQAITGHKSTQMLKRYTHISAKALVEAVRA
ncbi:site-specific integrase [Acidithiobacillus sp. YTS05]|nr:site-specific integrase [Acidithiobacillus sp. YTS05]